MFIAYMCFWNISRIHKYTPCPEKRCHATILKLCQMLSDLQNFFTYRLSSKFLTERWLNIPPHFKHVTRLTCEMFVLKNLNDPKLSEVNFHARFSSRIYSPNYVSIIYVHWQKDIYSDHNSSIKKKDTVMKCLRTQLACSHWQHELSTNKWLTLHQFDTCWSWSWGYWGVLNITWCCYNSFCLPHVKSQERSSSFSRTVRRVL